MRRKQPKCDTPKIIHLGEGRLTTSTNALIVRESNSQIKLTDGRYTGLMEETVKLLEESYNRIKSKPGNLTPGSTPETIDGISQKWIQKRSKELSEGQFQFSHSRRIQIPKPGKKETRPLTMPNPRDKVIERAMTSVLETIYEPMFRDSSHGFRPNRGTATVLNQIKGKYGWCQFVIEGDISKCYPSIKHEILLGIMRENIADEKFLELVRKNIENRYTEEGKLSQKSDVGIAQGTVVSPILCNIVLHRLDQYMEKLAAGYNEGKTRESSQEYRLVQRKVKKLEKLKHSLTIGSEEHKRARKEFRKTRSLRRMTPSTSNKTIYKRLYYVRYADDFIVGVNGPISDAKTIKGQIKEFLKLNLELELSVEKTKVTDLFKGEGAHFLGVDIKRSDPKGSLVCNKEGPHKGNKIHPKLQMKAPIQKILKRLEEKGYRQTTRRDKVVKGLAPKLRKDLVNLDHRDIIEFYNGVMRGILNYYHGVTNPWALWAVVGTLNHSCALTLSNKYKLDSRAKAFKKFGKNLKCPTTGKGLDLPKKLTSTGWWKKQPLKTPEEVLKTSRMSKMTKSSLGLPCIVCGKLPTEMHHVRKIWDLRQKAKKGGSDWFLAQMKAINRKQVPLCKDHHVRLHSNTLTDEERLNFKEGTRNLVRGTKRVKRKE